jgi:hypothetical protein
MKKLTLAEAATRVVMNLPQEDLHEGTDDRAMKPVVAYIENRLLSTLATKQGGIDEFKKMKALVDSGEKESQRRVRKYKESEDALEHSGWVLLQAILDAGEGVIRPSREADLKEVKRLLNIFKKLVAI